MLIAVYVASQLTSTYLMSTAMQSKAQRWMIMVLPILFLPFILGFPSGLMIYWLTTNLWTTGQGLITRRLMPKPVAPPKRSSRTPPKEATALVSSNGEPAIRTELGRECSRARERPAATREEEARRRPAATMSEQNLVTVEASGETVGEAKWAALRELESLVPGLDREQVQFQVVSEGERGLLGVGFSPAQVIASAQSDAAAERRPTASSRRADRARSSSGSPPRSGRTSRSRRASARAS